MQVPVVLVNGQQQHTVAVADRGFAYGDGVFETLLLHNNRPLFWNQHLTRLLNSCSRLGISTDALQVRLDADLSALQSLNRADKAVLKLIVTRGEGARGYYPDPTLRPTLVSSLSACNIAEQNAQTGVRIRWCQTRLGVNPALAGLKHLNRLEQVLARGEWQDATIAEGLMQDVQGRVVEGTMSNLFFVYQGGLCTPDLSGSGVAGILRQVVIGLARQIGLPVRVGEYSPAVVTQAQEIFITNSLIGIWPVVALENQHWPVGGYTRELQALLAQEIRK